MGKVTLSGMGGNTLVTGPEGWKAGSLVIPRIEGDKVKFRAGFKSTEYLLATAAAALLGPDQFSLTVIAKSGSEDQFVFSTSKASEYVAAFAQNGGRIQETDGSVETSPSPQSYAVKAHTPDAADHEGPPSADPVPPRPAPILADKKSALEHYSVIYLGGLPLYPKQKSGNSIDFLVTQDAFHLRPTMTSKWFAGLVIPYSSIASLDIVERQVSSIEGLLGGVNSRQLNQANNIHVEFTSDGQVLILRLEMLTGITVMGQAGKCRELMDRLRVLGVLGRFAGRATSATSSPTADIPGQIAKLATLRDQGILTNEEFDAKKTDLLSRL
jgi:hypothetical protein